MYITYLLSLTHALPHRSLRKAQDIQAQLLRHLQQLRLQVQSCGDDTTSLRRALTSGLFPHAARRFPDGTYKVRVGWGGGGPGCNRDKQNIALALPVFVQKSREKGRKVENSACHGSQLASIQTCFLTHPASSPSDLENDLAALFMFR